METDQISSKEPKKIKLDFKDSLYATGRRKKSIARVWLKKGSGKIHVNGKSYDSYFKRDSYSISYIKRHLWTKTRGWEPILVPYKPYMHQRGDGDAIQGLVCLLNTFPAPPTKTISIAWELGQEAGNMESVYNFLEKNINDLVQAILGHASNSN